MVVRKGKGRDVNVWKGNPLPYCVFDKSYSATEGLADTPNLSPRMLPACMFIAETLFITQDIFSSEILFVMREVQDLRFQCISLCL